MAVYIARVTRGNIYSSPYYLAYNSYTAGDYDLGMPNCTAYAYGRWNEISRVTSNPYWPMTGAGKDWYWQGQAGGYQVSGAGVWNPQVGAAISWTYGDDGHVAIVEQMHRDVNNNVDFIVCSNQAWRRQPDHMAGCPADFDWQDPTTGWANGFPFFYLTRIYASDPDDGHGAGAFNGFVYHPDFPPGVTPTPPSGERKNCIWMVSLPTQLRRLRWQ